MGILHGPRKTKLKSTQKYWFTSGSEKNTYFFQKFGSFLASGTYPKPIWKQKYPKCLCILDIFVYFGYVFGIHIFLSFWFEFAVIVLDFE